MIMDRRQWTYIAFLAAIFVYPMQFKRENSSAETENYNFPFNFNDEDK